MDEEISNTDRRRVLQGYRFRDGHLTLILIIPDDAFEAIDNGKCESVEVPGFDLEVVVSRARDHQHGLEVMDKIAKKISGAPLRFAGKDDGPLQ